MWKGKISREKLQKNTSEYYIQRQSSSGYQILGTKRIVISIVARFGNSQKHLASCCWRPEYWMCEANVFLPSFPLTFMLNSYKVKSTVAQLWSDYETQFLVFIYECCNRHLFKEEPQLKHMV